ncbi:DUF5819 family protein [Streptomyces sp. NY05-11A]|uniref:DUF5819 family protein n=1 Tax=Streptomyces soliscabiei TaxID=588897 RepID=UPI0029BACC6C|nr:DUF5819 family protein [Streptomyces sp. NY05-11A]MDX2677250.1 DUF5819 family protein [Streptomyces sp. NY05-11A]
MDAYDGGSGAPQGANTPGEADKKTAAGTEAAAEAEAETVEEAAAEAAAQTGAVAGASPAEGAVPGPRAGSAAPESGAASGPRAEPTGPLAWPAVVPSTGVVPAAGVVAVPPHPVPPHPEPPHPELPHPEPRTGVAALSPRYQIGAALALAVVAVAVCVHVGMVFLHVAPSNTVTKAHGKAIDEWIYPEFEQNWKLFAPNPLQQNIAVQVRAQVRTAEGGSRTTGWYDLSAQDGRAIDGNLLPSHTQQNELRRAWDFYTSTHGNDNRPVGIRGALSETYLRRIVVLRLERGGAAGDGGVVERVQVRSQTTNVTPPKWSDEKVSMSPVYRELPWWSVPDGGAEGGAR